MGINTTAHYYHHDEGESIVVEQEGSILFEAHANKEEIQYPVSIKEIREP